MSAHISVKMLSFHFQAQVILNQLRSQTPNLLTFHKTPVICLIQMFRHSGANSDITALLPLQSTKSSWIS